MAFDLDNEELRATRKLHKIMMIYMKKQATKIEKNTQ